MMKRSVGIGVLGLSASGYPLTQVVMRRWGRPGAIAVEAVCIGLAIRDAFMVASGVPDRLQRVPGALLRLELAAGAVASITGLLALRREAKGRTSSGAAHGVDVVRRVALMILFGLHTIRFWIYLQPDQGRRRAA